MGQPSSTSNDVDDKANDDISSSDSSDSSTSLTTDDTQNDETTEDEENCETSDEEDATPKSKKVIITDFVSSCLMDKKEDMCCGQFTKLRETAQKRVQQWNCSCDLFPALLNIEGSPDKNGIALAIINCHGFMYGDHQYLVISEKSTCKRCVSPIPLAKVMAALDYTQKNIMCALFACRVQKAPESGYDRSSDASSLATRFVSLLMPCGPGSLHSSHNYADPTRHLLLKTLDECKSMREAVSLHGQFIYEMRYNGMDIGKMNDTPIEVLMTDDWMRHDETNDDGLTPPKRSRMEELSPHEKLMNLFSTYKSKESHEKSCGALAKLRFHVVFYWEAIVSTQSSDFKTQFLNDIVEALKTETDVKLIDRLVQVVVEAAMSSIDRTTGFQTWSEIVRFIENSFNTGSVSLKMKVLSILSKAPNLFGRDVGLPLFFMKSCMEDSNMGIQSAAIEWLFAVLRMKEEPSEEQDLSTLIPILMQRSEKRMIEKNFHLIRSLENLAGRFRALFPISRSSAISLNNLVVLCLTEQKEKIIGRRKMLVDIITVLAEKDETRAEVAQFIKSCAHSTYSSMKIIALSIVSRAFNIVDCSEAPWFFERLLYDEDSSVRSGAVEAFTSFTRQVKNEDTIGQLSNLIPVVIEIIKGIAEDERSGHFYSLLKLIEAHPIIIDAKHIPAVVEFYMRIRIESVDQWEKDGRLDKLDWKVQGRLLTALKESNALKTAISIAHSFMHNGDWKEKCMGLRGLVAIAKKGRGPMEEHIEKMTPLFNDPNPRVRSFACLALGEIASHSDSKFEEKTHEMIILPLISALKDEISKVAAHAASVLRIDNCPKEILMRHLNPLIEGTLEFALKEIRSGKKGHYLDYQIVRLLSLTVEKAEEFIAPLNPDIMGLIKSCIKECVKMKKLEFLGDVSDCISLVGRSMVKEVFMKDVDEILPLLVGGSSMRKGLVYKGIGRWCEIIGSDFARLLPHVIEDIVEMASSDPLNDKPCTCRMACSDYMFDPERSDADEALTILAKTLGVDFAPYVDEVFKAAQQHLKYPACDYACWSSEIFPLLLACLDSKGVDAKRVLWTQFWPAFKVAVKETNENVYSAMAMKSIARTIEILGSEGLSEEETTAIVEWIEYEVEAIKMRREEKDDDDSEAAIMDFLSPEDYEKLRNDEEWKKWDEEEKEGRDEARKEFENGVFEALQELCKVGETILGLSISIDGFPMTDLIGDDGAEESNLSLIKESTDDEISTAIE